MGAPGGPLLFAGITQRRPKHSTPVQRLRQLSSLIQGLSGTRRGRRGANLTLPARLQ